jgi:adenylate cyclase
MDTQSSTESRTAANRRPPGGARASKNERLCDLTEALRVDRDPTAGGAVPSGSRTEDTGRDDRSPSAEAAREQLDRILASGEFVAPDRLKSFLRFAVEETLAGRAERLKAYTIAVDVFGRNESFDPLTDPVVRMEAGKLRRRLERYYLGAGQDDAIRIEIPKGTYTPTFLLHNDGERAKAASADPAPGFRRHIAGNALWGLGGAVALGLILLATVWLRSEAPSPEVGEGFPTLQGRGSAIMVLPFENLAQNDADDFFAAGLTEELISNLMRFGELRLYSVFGSFQERPTADAVALSRRLDVGYVIKGSFRRGANQSRLIVHLIEAQTGKHLWTRAYDRGLTPWNVFAMQEEIAADLGNRLAQAYGIINEVSAESRTPVGREVQVAVVRNGKVQDLAATLAPLPEAQVPAQSGLAR